MIIENLYSIISNTCVGGGIYALYYPDKNVNFIRYNTPFIATLFINDIDFIKLCERYEYYVSLPLVFKEPKSNSLWHKQTGHIKYFHAACNPQYPVFHLDDIEIHCIHDSKPFLVKKKFKGRLEEGLTHKRIFVWSAAEMLNFHEDSERKNLIHRFMNISDYSIFLTNRREEIYEDEKHLCYFNSDWDGLSDSDRYPDSFIVTWQKQNNIVDILKNLITTKIINREKIYG